jgi:hypothetical protein
VEGVARTGEARGYYSRSVEILAVRLLVQTHSMPEVWLRFGRVLI